MKTISLYLALFLTLPALALVPSAAADHCETPNDPVDPAQCDVEHVNIPDVQPPCDTADCVGYAWGITWNLACAPANSYTECAGNWVDFAYPIVIGVVDGSREALCHMGVGSGCYGPVDREVDEAEDRVHRLLP